MPKVFIRTWVKNKLNKSIVTLLIGYGCSKYTTWMQDRWVFKNKAFCSKFNRELKLKPDSSVLKTLSGLFYVIDGTLFLFS
jgi:hypothetical protein